MQVSCNCVHSHFWRVFPLKKANIPWSKHLENRLVKYIANAKLYIPSHTGLYCINNMCTDTQPMTMITINHERKKFILLWDPCQGPSSSSRTYTLPVLPLVGCLEGKARLKMEVNKRDCHIFVMGRKAFLPTFSPLYALMDSRVDEITGCMGVALDPQRI